MACAQRRDRTDGADSLRAGAAWLRLTLFDCAYRLTNQRHLCRGVTPPWSTCEFASETGTKSPTKSATRMALYEFKVASLCRCSAFIHDRTAMSASHPKPTLSNNDRNRR